MPKYLLSLAFILIVGLNANAADIIVQSGSTSNAYETLSDAMDAARTGDFIYVPAGSYDVSDLYFDKGVHMVGAGYNPYDGDGETTVFSGSLKIYTGADGGSVQGIRMSGGMFFGTGSDDNTVSDFTITRCYIHGLYLAHCWNCIQSGTGFTITENIIAGAFHGGDAANTVFANNIVYQTSVTDRAITVCKNAIIENNIIITIDNITFNSTVGCIVRNNIFPVGNMQITNSRNENHLINNLYCSTEDIVPYGYTMIEGNVRIDREDLFVDQSGGSFEFSHDYHLTPTALGAITGTDGAQVGIYGGPYPFKDGGAPINPQIIEKRISTATNPEGHLKVEIRVKAQNK
ncbi:MAG: hypothetical protein ACLFQX_08080 [Candidatus Kapaibacterium sp.]